LKFRDKNLPFQAAEVVCENIGDNQKKLYQCTARVDKPELRKITTFKTAVERALIDNNINEDEARTLLSTPGADKAWSNELLIGDSRVTAPGLCLPELLPRGIGKRKPLIQLGCYGDKESVLASLKRTYDIIWKQPGGREYFEQLKDRDELQFSFLNPWQQDTNPIVFTDPFQPIRFIEFNKNRGMAPPKILAGLKREFPNATGREMAKWMRQNHPGMNDVSLGLKKPPEQEVQTMIRDKPKVPGEKNIDDLLRGLK
jgi:hypothetical protein